MQQVLAGGSTPQGFSLRQALAALGGDGSLAAATWVVLHQLVHGVDEQSPAQHAHVAPRRMYSQQTPGFLLLTALASSYHVSHTYTVNAYPPCPRDRGGAPCSRLEYMHAVAAKCWD